MPNNYFSDPLIFLIETLFGLYMGIVALRIIMQWAQWEYHNQIVQIIIKTTQIPVKFLRQFIPAFGRWDTATVILLLIITLLKIAVISLLQFGQLEPLTLLKISILDIFSLFITLFTVSIIVQALLSWITPHQSNPITPLISKMNAPILRPIRKLIPTISGLDLSPLIAIIGLHVLSLLIRPLLIAA